MGECHHALQLVEVVLQGPAVLRIRVCLDRSVLSPHEVLDVFFRLLVAGEDSGLSAGLDRHVGDGEPVGDGHVVHTLSAELERFVISTVYPDVADDLQHEVLSSHVFPEFAVEDDLDGLGNLEPQLAGGEHHSGLGGSDSGGKRIYSTVSAGVGVGADDEPAGSGETLLDHELVADSALSDLEVIGEVVLLHEIPHLLGLDGGCDVLVGNIVVRDEDHPLLEHLPVADLVVFPECDGAGDVVDHHVVNIGDHDLSRFGIGVRMRGQDLLCDCLSHLFTLPDECNS